MKVFCILSDERAFFSKSPVMHTAVLKEFGIQGIYVPFMVKPELIKEAVNGLRALNISGANVTVPYKEAVMPYLDFISEEALAIGAVNTIVPENEKLKGYNTDASGLMDVLKIKRINDDCKSALVFGTGGASKAVVFALKKMGISRIVIAGRNKVKTTHIANLMGLEPTSLKSLAEKSLPASLVINATSVSSPDESQELALLIANLNLPECKWVIDINYGRIKNFWKDLAISKNAGFIDGLPMLAHQARRSFALWTGIEAEPDLFLQYLGVKFK
ncbi:Shikimate dehydrogenase (NADP(+)) [Candidatus Magnetomoraceae bacterium gMMP-1]